MAKTKQPDKFLNNVLPRLDDIASMVKNGITTAEIAKELGISKNTFFRYIERGKNGEKPYVRLSDCYTRAQGEANEEVKGALLRLATGYTISLKKTFKVREVEYDDYGKKIREYEHLVQGEDEMHVPANVMAQQFWLCNRDSDNWQYHGPDKNKDKDDDKNSETGIVLMPPVQEVKTDG